MKANCIEYWQASISAKKGSPTKLPRIVKKDQSCLQHESLSYNQAKSFLLSRFYVQKIGSGFVVRDVYCQTNYPVPGPGAVPNAAILNIEHTWPQSRFTSQYDKNVQKADLHHLFPTDSELNSIRGNYPFGEVDKEPKPLKCQTSRFGVAKETNQLVFEPPPEHRGNVARALFYFSIRYEIKIDDKQEAFLRSWHKEDPVDQEELIRNEAIFKVQGNRNPFIDMPELVPKIRNF